MWEKAAGRDEARGSSLSVESVIADFLAWADTYYRRADGSPTREAVNCEIALRPIRGEHGAKGIDDITYDDILAARESLIGQGLTRPTINQRVGVWKRFFAWALENRKCQATTKAEVWAIGSLKRNRTPAPEGRQVGPVRHADVKKTLPHLPGSLRAMVVLQELTGMRPGEVCAIRPADIEKKPGVWVYRPAQHKTAHRDNVRVVVLGPRAQAVLSPHLAGKPDAPAFSPEASTAERGKIRGKRRDGKSWTTSAYGQAIEYAILRARREGATVADWTPNQLRHACGTRVRRRFGVGAARAVLGHTDGARITDRYTRDAIEAEIIAVSARAMARIG
jgi:integrase